VGDCDIGFLLRADAGAIIAKPMPELYSVDASDRIQFLFGAPHYWAFLEARFEDIVLFSDS
jgi:hypothetical protein